VPSVALPRRVDKTCRPLPTDSLINLIIRRDARWLKIHPDVLQYLLDVNAVRDEKNDSHLLAKDRAGEGTPGRSGVLPLI
jgi:hypothetical protein